MLRHNLYKVFLLFSVVLLLLSNMAQAGPVPQLINYQGSLMKPDGSPVANGQYGAVFSIYDVATGGTPLWSETWNAATSPVATNGGVFNVILGTYSPIPVAFFSDHPGTYLGVKVGNDSEMLPRQKITSVGYAFTAGNGIPKGGIIMWSGAVNQMPEGWALCDGNNGTPNLKDRFVVGAGSGYAVGATGGEATHVLTVNEMPSHTHIQDAHNHAQNPHRHNQAQANIQDTGSGRT